MRPSAIPGGGFTGQGRRPLPMPPPGVMDRLQARLGGGGQMAGGPMAGGTGVGPYGNPFFNQISQAPPPPMPRSSGFPERELPRQIEPPTFERAPLFGGTPATEQAARPDNFYY